MKTSKLNNLNTYYLVAIFTFCIDAIIGLCSTYCYLSNQMGIPNGFYLGGALAGLSYFLLGLVERKEKQNRTNKLTIVIIVFRLVLFIAIFSLLSYFYFSAKVNIFHPLTFLGGYLVSLVVLLIVMIFKKEKE